MKSGKKMWLISVLGLMGIWTACKKEAPLVFNPVPGLGGDTWVKNSIDQWLYDSVTKDYNINIIYKYDRTRYGDELRNLEPMKENKVIPYSAQIKRIFFEVFDSVTGSKMFIKKYAPKQLVLVGGASSAIGGFAEGSNRVVLYNGNTFTGSVSGTAHLLYHEMTHVFNAVMGVPNEYAVISAADYGNQSQYILMANNQGFVTSYAGKNPLEDFAELTSYFIADSLVLSASLANANEVGKARLQAKLKIMVNYYREKFGFDIYKLRNIYLYKKNLAEQAN